jgi:hypothetical protein
MNGIIFSFVFLLDRWSVKAINCVQKLPFRFSQEKSIDRQLELPCLLEWPCCIIPD